MLLDKIGPQKSRRHYALDEKKFHVEQWKLSHLTRIAYCRQAGVPFKTFTRWLKDFPSTSIPPLSFAPVLTPSHRSNHTPETRIEIDFANGVRCCFVNVPEPTLLITLIEGVSHAIHPAVR